MLACYRVPIRLTETTSHHIAGHNGQPPRRRTKLLRGPRAPIVSAIDAWEARDKAAEMFPGAEVGEPEFLHRDFYHRMNSNATAAHLEVMGWR